MIMSTDEDEYDLLFLYFLTKFYVEGVEHRGDSEAHGGEHQGGKHSHGDPHHHHQNPPEPLQVGQGETNGAPLQ